MSTVDVTLPSLGESVTEGIVTKWFKAVGDVVVRDEPLYEISTDKVDSEMPAPAAGVLAEILVAEGDTVEVGGRLAVIADSLAGAAPSPASVAVAPVAVAPVAEAPVAARAARAAPVVEVKRTAAVAATPDGAVTSPVVRRILEGAGLDPTAVAGTGPGGVVTRKDAERAVSEGPVDDEVRPLTNVRRRMAEHMAASVQTSPHAFVAVEVDAAPITRVRELGGATADGDPIDATTVVAVALVRALGEFELLNATLVDEGLMVHHGVNLGIVLGLDDGMLVPVIHAAAGLTLRALAKRMADLAERTESRQLVSDDLMGATVSIAGAPAPSVLFTVPILIQPQVAIVSVGASQQRVVARPDGSYATVERVVLGCSFDHRVVDATYVARFLDRVGALLAGLDVDSER